MRIEFICLFCCWTNGWFSVSFIVLCERTSSNALHCCCVNSQPTHLHQYTSTRMRRILVISFYIICCLQFPVRSSQFDIESNSKPISQPKRINDNNNEIPRNIWVNNFQRLKESNLWSLWNWSSVTFGSGEDFFGKIEFEFTNLSNSNSNSIQKKTNSPNRIL